MHPPPRERHSDAWTLPSKRRSATRTITLPGIGGSDEHHWQTFWEQTSFGLHRFTPSSWDEPDFDDWSEALDRAVGDESAVLVAHSLSCLLAVRWSHANPGRVAGLFLVAAPDPSGPRFPSQAESFASGLDVQAEVPAVLVASDNDPYCSAEQSVAIAHIWRIPLITLGERGRVNSASGLGFWVEGHNLFTAFEAGLSRRRSATIQMPAVPDNATSHGSTTGSAATPAPCRRSVRSGRGTRP